MAKMALPLETGEDFTTLDELDSWDSDAIYDILENDLAPLYYNKGEDGLPTGWIQMMKHSIVSVSSEFNTHRMVKDYVNDMYMPALQNGRIFRKDDFSRAASYISWRDQIRRNWSNVEVRLHKKELTESETILKYNDPLKLKAIVKLGAIDPGDVKVQVYLSSELHHEIESSDFELIDMSRKKKIEEGVYAYEAEITPSNSGNYRYTIRVMPFSEYEKNMAEMGLVTWLS